MAGPAMNKQKCMCPQCVAERYAAWERKKQQDDAKDLALVQRQSVTLADLYRRGRAQGLLAGSRGY